jgi:type VI secretion system protein ImpF
MAIAGNPQDIKTTPSLLDRLFDNQPLPPWEKLGREREMRLQSKRFQDVQDLKRCVARDLELLLNTKRELQSDLPDEAVDLKRSLVTYGLPDFTAYSLSSKMERNRIARAMEQSISIHESRLRRVRIVIDDPKPFERALRFRVDALLQVEPAREPVSFDAVLQLSTQQYQVKGKE